MNKRSEKGEIGLFRAGMPVLLLLINFSWAQNLETVWTDVINLDTRLKSARLLETEWKEMQETIGVEIQSLQKNQTWFNGWFNELALARRNTAQVRIADSLQKIQESIAELIIRREDTFRTFKKSYENLVLTGKNHKTLSELEKEQAITLGRWWVRQKGQSLKLPDYASILNSPYEDPQIRRLVTRDLRLVLQDKLVLIDSLIHEHETTAALLERLNEFHADLGLEMDANLELAAGGSQVSGNSDGLTASGSSDNGGKFSEEESYRVGDIVNIETALNQELSSPGLEAVLLSKTPANSGSLNLLKNKRQEYLQLLELIETELKP
ncbi:MAG: hypothetical protein V3S48_05370 [Candidatus Neomarinimicrobiota bacterium]